MSVKFNLSLFLVLVRQREKSQKFFDLSALNENLNHSNLCDNVGAMNFQKWELFPGSPDTVCKIVKEKLRNRLVKP